MAPEILYPETTPPPQGHHQKQTASKLRLTCILHNQLSKLTIQLRICLLHPWSPTREMTKMRKHLHDFPVGVWKNTLRDQDEAPRARLLQVMALEMEAWPSRCTWRLRAYEKEVRIALRPSTTTITLNIQLFWTKGRTPILAKHVNLHPLCLFRPTSRVHQQHYVQIMFHTQSSLKVNICLEELSNPWYGSKQLGLFQPPTKHTQYGTPTISRVASSRVPFRDPKTNNRCSFQTDQPPEVLETNQATGVDL